MVVFHSPEKQKLLSLRGGNDLVERESVCNGEIGIGADKIKTDGADIPETVEEMRQTELGAEEEAPPVMRTKDPDPADTSATGSVVPAEWEGRGNLANLRSLLRPTFLNPSTVEGGH